MRGSPACSSHPVRCLALVVACSGHLPCSPHPAGDYLRATSGPLPAPRAADPASEACPDCWARSRSWIRTGGGHGTLPRRGARLRASVGWRAGWRPHVPGARAGAPQLALQPPGDWVASNGPRKRRIGGLAVSGRLGGKQRAAEAPDRWPCSLRATGWQGTDRGAAASEGTWRSRGAAGCGTRFLAGD